MKKIDLTGHQYGELTVLKDAGVINKTRRWLCKCSCGNTKEIIHQSLRSGDAKSCGCKQYTKRTKHGHTKKGKPSKEYSTWIHMKQRCIDTSNPSYDNYGGRGIKICDKWLNSFEEFFKDVGPAPNKNSNIDRINTNGNYEPGNVRWVNKRVSSINRNTPSNNKSGVKGVCWNKKMKKWEVYISIEKYKKKTLGYYTDLEAAKTIRKKAEEKYYDE